MPAAATIPVDRIDAELPQTQCRKCGFDGCRPYAEAIVDGEAINRCPPGGEATRDRLAALTGQPALALIEAPQTPLLAVIREAECIGCTKCIQACPVDAIVGAAKQMHSVINAECTGCELCMAPCPVDCIDLIEHPQWRQAENDAERAAFLDARASNGRRRFEARNQRLARRAVEKQQKREQRIAATRASQASATTERAADSGQGGEQDLTALKAQRATLAARYKRTQRQLEKAETAQRPGLHERLDAFTRQLEALDHRLGLAVAGNEFPQQNHQHIAVAAAEQARRKARQELAHFERLKDTEGAARAQEKILAAERLIALAHHSTGGGAGGAKKDQGTQT
ncbi:RnfABCDGE type electron transport complex subunit B [Salinicola avicenniae]|uniref:RnfABCDGE type electron transport complex subunit B n=1 Tax=Salinicola avicenniae TaxID=2916836 RepID=UPI00207433AA|nr:MULTISPECIES: RnfABCDGE type electron transport complex subunit B [unclassified Salinicola]